MDFDLLTVFLENLQAMSVAKQERILIAVSGGPDSMALLHLFVRWNVRNIGAFHLNHGFRETAARDAAFVRDYCRDLHIPVEIQEYDINRYLAASGESKQQGARKIRYQLLKNFAEAGGYHRIALGHHGDDQAETVLMRILRGSGLHGLGGIPMQRGMFIRPLLTVSKEEIIRYCQFFGVPYVQDETNLEPIYLRNKVRQELLPLLAEEYNPEIMTRLVQLADLAREDELELQTQAEEICRKHMRWQRGQLTFPRGRFLELSTAMQRRVLRRLLELYRGHLRQISFVHIEQWRRQILENPSFQLTLPQVWVSGNVEYIFVGTFSAEEWEPVELTVPGQVQAGGFTVRAELWERDQLPPRTEDCEDFDLEELQLPLVIRPRREGDRLRPFGGAGTKKVKDLFIEARIPVQLRDFLPLICDQEGILWIPTVRRSHRAALSDSTRKVLRLSYGGQGTCRIK
ncbi:MAG TPA: tRNA lysidine(34) synthetase TilS [Firmicutes bacterium]|nr:tRNA lysidine(34) synthetase TilS [Bacillota bacterium]